MIITLSGNPKSTQQIYRSACRGGRSMMYMSKEGKDIKAQYILEARSQWKEKPLEGDIKLSIVLYFGDKRIRDVDNFNKLALDALSDIVWIDDKQIQELNIKKNYDKENPRIEIALIKGQINK